MVVVRAGLAFVAGFSAILTEYIVSVATLVAQTWPLSLVMFLPLPLYAVSGALGFRRLELRIGFAVGLAVAIGLWVVVLEQSLALDLLFTVPAALTWLVATWWRGRRPAVAPGS